MTTESNNQYHSIGSSAIIYSRITQIVNDFIRLRNEFLDNDIPEITVENDRQESFLDRFRLVDSELVNAQMTRKNIALVVCGANSSGKSAFVQYFLQIGKILPSAIGAVSARIVKLTYATAEQACFRIYESKTRDDEEYDELKYESSLASHFALSNPWKMIEQQLKEHLERPSDFTCASHEVIQWAQRWIEIRVPSPILALGVNVYDTPGFLSSNREEFLNQNLYSVITKVCPTILFLYDNPAITQTDANCFLQLTKVLQAFDDSRIFFLNTKADINNILQDNGLAPNQSISVEKFKSILEQTRQYRYDLLRRQSAMSNETIGALPANVHECDCFDICSIPTSARTRHGDCVRIMNDACFQRIIAFALDSVLEPILALVQWIRSIINDFFDFAASANHQNIKYWSNLREEAMSWSLSFIHALQDELPSLVERMHENILTRFDHLSPSMIQRAARLAPINNESNLVTDTNQTRIRDHLEQIINEEVIKVAANESLNNATEIIMTLDLCWKSLSVYNRNEFIGIAQRTVMSNIGVKSWNKKTLLMLLSENFKRVPSRLKRLARFVTLRPWANFYKVFQPSQIPTREEAEFGIFDAIDNYSVLLNEAARETFARKRLTIMRERLLQQRQCLRTNLTDWINGKRQEFYWCIEKSYQCIIRSFDKRQIVDGLSRRFFGRFAQIECQLLAVEESVRFFGVEPILHEYIRQGACFNIRRAEWGDVQGLIVKQPSHIDPDEPYLSYIEAHYHRTVTESLPDNCIVPLLYLYEHQVEVTDTDIPVYELWIFMPEFKQTLQHYLQENIEKMDFKMLSEIAIEIATILSELHRLKIVHRGLKSSKILLDDDNHCHMSGFGTCYRGTFNRTVVRMSPSSPEMLTLKQSSNTTNYDGESVDIFSLGTILYELLPKKKYHRMEHTDEQNIRLIIKENIHSDIDLHEYEDLIVHCLQPNPDLRPTAVQVIECLHSLIQNYHLRKQSSSL